MPLSQFPFSLGMAITVVWKAAPDKDRKVRRVSLKVMGKKALMERHVMGVVLLEARRDDEDADRLKDGEVVEGEGEGEERGEEVIIGEEEWEEREDGRETDSMGPSGSLGDATETGPETQPADLTDINSSVILTITHPEMGAILRSTDNSVHPTWRAKLNALEKIAKMC